MKRPIIGIVGLPGSGKTTVFRALLGKGHCPEAERRDLAVSGILSVPDKRLDVIVKILCPKRWVHATLELTDFPPMLGESRGKTSGELVNRLRQTDMLMVVLGGFERDSEAPAAQFRKLWTELLLADLQLIEGAKERLQKDSRRRGLTADEKEKFDHLETARLAIERGGNITAVERASFHWLSANSFPLLTVKPYIVVLNLMEGVELSVDHEEFADAATRPIPLCARTELELMDLPEEEAETFRQAMKMDAPPQETIARGCLKALKLVTFYTVVGEEIRAWLLREGSTAIEAAGEIHTDMARGFVKAEVVSFDDFAALGSFKQVRNAGRLALEGRDYVVKDGDILTIRFSK